MKSRDGKSQRREEKRREEKRRRKKIKKRKSPKKEDPGARKGGKVATHGGFPMICVKNWRVRSTFGSWGVEKSVRRCGAKHNDGRGGTYAEDMARCISHGRRSTRYMLIRAVRRSGRWFPERGCILEHQIFRFGKMILHDRCSTSYDMASLCRGRRNTLDRWSGKTAKRIGTRPSTLHSTFHFWRKSCRVVSFLTLSTS